MCRTISYHKTCVRCSTSIAYDWAMEKCELASALGLCLDAKFEVKHGGPRFGDIIDVCNVCIRALAVGGGPVKLDPKQSEAEAQKLGFSPNSIRTFSSAK